MAIDINIKQLVQNLQGTCMTLDGGIQSVLGDNTEVDSFDLSEDQHNQLESEIFLCSCCGWWYETCEDSGQDETDLICLDCSDKDEEE
jgi:hypothetical protein